MRQNLLNPGGISWISGGATDSLDSSLIASVYTSVNSAKARKEARIGKNFEYRTTQRFVDVVGSSFVRPRVLPRVKGQVSTDLTTVLTAHGIKIDPESNKTTDAQGGGHAELRYVINCMIAASYNDVISKLYN